MSTAENENDSLAQALAIAALVAAWFLRDMPSVAPIPPWFAIVLLAIAAAFAAPIAAAMFFYFTDNGWRPGEV